MTDNRVLAQLIWLSIVVSLLLLAPKTRVSICGILKAFTVILRKLSTWIAFGWFIIIIYFASRIRLWGVDLMIVTVWWSLASGPVLFYDAATSTSDMRFFTRRLRNLLSVTVVVEILIALAEMPLLFELLLVPISFILVVIITLSDNKKSNIRPMGSCAKYIALIIGVLLIIFNIWSWASGRVSIPGTELARGTILPIYLTIMFCPILYCLTIYSRWELLYKRIKNLTSTGPYIRRLRKRLSLLLTVIQESGLHLTSLRFIPRPIMLHRILSSDQPNEVRRNIRSELEKARREEVNQRELAERLERYTGVAGVDEQGRQLDRREFSKTCKILDWLHTCHIGWWRHNEHYVAGLITVGPPTEPFPNDNFHEVLSDKADAWFIWRRTITGWVFAIGADGPPPSLWYYDGPDPPSGLPHEGSEWKNSTAGEQSLNWD